MVACSADCDCDQARHEAEPTAPTGKPCLINSTAGLFCTNCRKCLGEFGNRARRPVRSGSSSVVRGEPHLGQCPCGGRCPPYTGPSLPRKRHDPAAGAVNAGEQIRTWRRALALQFVPLVLAPQQVGVDLGLVVQIEGDSPRTREPGSTHRNPHGYSPANTLRETRRRSSLA